MAELKDILKKLRSEKNMSQAELADELSCGLSTVASWETGNRFPRRPYMEQLADIFNVDIDYLYGPTELRQCIHFDNDGHMMVHLSDEEYQVIKSYRSSDSVTKEMVLRILKIDKKKDCAKMA